MINGTKKREGERNRKNRQSKEGFPLTHFDCRLRNLKKNNKSSSNFLHLISEIIVSGGHLLRCWLKGYEEQQTV